MWTLFKIINIWWLLSSTYVWIMALMPMPILLVLANASMLICFSFLPIKFHFDAKLGWVIFAILLLTLWSTWIDGWINGIMTMLQYIPVLFLLQLPYEYQKDLLKFVTKWYAIFLAPGLLLYWALLFTSLPSFGTFVHPVYKPFTNYIFYLKTTFDYGTFERFNAFFLEPGHQALVSTFLMMANKFDFRKCPWLIIMALGVAFSFSLAGYLLSIVGFLLLKVNSLTKALVSLGALALVGGGAYIWSGGDNALNEMIISRLEYDESSGIKGNNRFFDNTDFEYERALKSKYLWIGVKTKANMNLISGAGYKIYILNYGMVGVLLALIFYLTVIPARPDYRYTISFLIVLTLCFLQRAYPFWYSWLFPYVVGIYIAKGDKTHSKAESETYHEDSEGDLSYNRQIK